MAFVIIQTGGKQYTVRPGDTLDVEKLTDEVGSTVELESVLLVSRDGEVAVGRPTVPGAKVIAQRAISGCHWSDGIKSPVRRVPGTCCRPISLSWWLDDSRISSSGIS